MKKYILITGIALVVTQQAQAILLTTSYDANIWQDASRSPTPFTIDITAFNNRPQTLQWDNLPHTLNKERNARLDYPTSIHAEVDILQLYKDKKTDAEPATKKNYQPQVRIPEPSSLGLMLLGAIGIVIIRRKNHG